MRTWFDTNKKLLSLIVAAVLLHTTQLSVPAFGQKKPSLKNTSLPQRAAYDERQKVKAMIDSLVKAKQAITPGACLSSQCESAWSKLAAVSSQFGALGPSADPAQNPALIKESYVPALLGAMDAMIQENPGWQNDTVAARYMVQYSDVRGRLLARAATTGSIGSSAALSIGSIGPSQAELFPSELTPLDGSQTLMPRCAGGCAHPIKHAVCDAGCAAAAATAGALACTIAICGSPVAVAVCAGVFAALGAACMDAFCAGYCEG